MDNNSGVANGYKGYKYGFDYTIDKNIVLKTSVVNAKGIAHPNDLYHMARAEVFFSF